MPRTARLTLLASVLAGPASTWALGIGDIQLESYLGQPFRASVELLAGPDEALEESCFQVKSGNETGLPGVSGIAVSLQRKSGGTRLLLNSRRPVNEPAVSITVISDCPQRLSRQFMVLLDPPLVADTPVVQDAGAQSAAGPATPAAAPPAAHPAAPALKARSTKAAGKPASARPHRATHARKTGAVPRLVLSGHHPAMAESPAFGLKLDKNLPEPGKYAGNAADVRDLSDENASLNHKLAYLEAQLASLQRRNAELEQAELAAQAVRPKPQPAPAYSWYAWLPAPALLAAGMLLAWRWRRKRMALRQPAEEELWPLTANGETQAASAWQMDPLPASLDKPSVALPSAGGTPAAESQPADTPPRTLKWAEDEGMEVDDSVVDEAEVFMAHGHADLAINLLEEHVRAAPNESPIPWMLLLDLLRRNKMAREYEETGKACKQHFNLRVPDWSEDEPGPEAAGLEAYPHILAELTRLWKSAECQTYLDDLIFDRRGGTRTGFDPPTFREIMLLRTIQAGEPASLPDPVLNPTEKRVAGLP